jgi:hypothetical protein
VRALIVVPLLAGLACSDGSVRSGSVPEPADFLPTVADTTAQPQVLLRCENGHLGAYLVLDLPDDRESGPPDSGAVPVALDSAPAC